MRNPVAGVILVVLGGVFLLQNLDLMPDIHIGRLIHTWWPVILIAVGLRMLMRGERGARS